MTDPWWQNNHRAHRGRGDSLRERTAVGMFSSSNPGLYFPSVRFYLSQRGDSHRFCQLASGVMVCVRMSPESPVNRQAELGGGDWIVETYSGFAVRRRGLSSGRGFQWRAGPHSYLAPRCLLWFSACGHLELSSSPARCPSALEPANCGPHPLQI